MNEYTTNVLALNKRTIIEVDWLKSIGWKVIDPWTIKGNDKVAVVSPDRYSECITDVRYKKFVKHWDFMNK
jgi:hypothetical protein